MRLIPYFCTFCQKNTKYKSIETELNSMLSKGGFLYNLKDFETLNYKTYACSECGSSDRDRLYKLYIDKFEFFTNKSVILDFAPSSQFEKYLRPHSKKYRTADLMIDGVDDKVDITNMKQYKDNMFDFFICSHILEHVDDDKMAMHELFRVLKPGGRGILMTPIIDKEGIQDESPNLKSKEERIRRFAQDDHVRLYEKNVFLNRVKESGFIIKAFGTRDIGLLDCILNGIGSKSKLYVVQKPSK